MKIHIGNFDTQTDEDSNKGEYRGNGTMNEEGARSKVSIGGNYNNSHYEWEGRC